MDKSERRKKLEQTMKEFNKSNKESLLDFGTSSKEIEVIPTGIKIIDDFTGGGSKKGSFSIIYGGFSVGKSTLVLQQIADAQKEGNICCYIDLEHSFDKDRAKQLGVNLEDLILAEKCKNAEQALEIIRKLCKEKVVDYVAVDSVQAMSPLNEQENKGKERQLVEKEIAELARTLSKFFRVVAPDVFNARVSVVMIGQIRIHGIGTFFTRAGLTGGEALKHWANQMIFIRGGQGADAPMNEQKRYFLDKEGKLRYKTEKIKVGFDAVLKLEKTKSSESAVENSDIHVPFIYKEGFVSEFNPEEQEIEIAGTDEQKDEIRRELIKKGVLPAPSNAEMGFPEIDDKKIKLRPFTNKESEALNKPVDESKILKMVKDEVEAISEVKDVSKSKKELEKIEKIEKPKAKRGRPKKDK